MSEKTSGKKQRGLALPSPRSPEALDDRILAHARASVPVKRGASPLGWASGIATAAVLVMAVYLVNLSDNGTVATSPVADTTEEETSARREFSENAPAQAQAEPRPKLKMSAAKNLDADFAAREMAEASAATAPPSQGTIADQGVNRALVRFRELVKADKREQAEREYAELRKSCSDCGLPEDLDKALAMVPGVQ